MTKNDLIPQEGESKQERNTANRNSVIITTKYLSKEKRSFSAAKNKKMAHIREECDSGEYIGSRSGIVDSKGRKRRRSDKILTFEKPTFKKNFSISDDPFMNNEEMFRGHFSHSCDIY